MKGKFTLEVGPIQPRVGGRPRRLHAALVLDLVDHPGAPGPRGPDSDSWNNGYPRAGDGRRDLQPPASQSGLGEDRHLDPPAEGPEPGYDPGGLRRYDPG